jgi:plasmid stabilization system protein ParE
MVLEWTDPALDDLEIIRDYIAKDSPYYAKRFIERIFDAAEKFQNHPQMGRLVPEANRDDVRELIFQAIGSSTVQNRIACRSSP